MKYSKVEQRVLVVSLDTVLQVMAFHGVVKVTMQQFDSVVVSTATPSIKEAMLVNRCI